MWPFKKKVKKQVVEQEQPKQEVPVEKVEKPVVEEPLIEQKPQEKKPEEKIKPVKKEEAKKVPVEPVIEEPQETAAQKAQKYHVSQNKDPKSDSYKKWRVRKEGSNKTIKFFDTQKEAIEFAESLADKAGSSVVIHKIDGSIRKQDYTKKA